jgi:Protein of unknown function DUF262
MSIRCRRSSAAPTSFEIPSYQRPYSWEEDQVGALFDDVLAAMRRAGERADREPYFLGSLVLIKAPGSSRASGRWSAATTLTLLFPALRDMISREDVRARRLRFRAERPAQTFVAPGRADAPDASGGPTNEPQTLRA